MKESPDAAATERILRRILGKDPLNVDDVRRIVGNALLLEKPGNPVGMLRGASGFGEVPLDMECSGPFGLVRG